MASYDHVVVATPEARTFGGGDGTTARVRVRTVVDHQMLWVAEELIAEQVVVERVPVNREIDAAPDVRREGDVLIVPIVEEVLVVQKRLMLKEELRIRKVSVTQQVDEPVSVCAVRAVIDSVGQSHEDTPILSESSTSSAAR